MALQKVRRLRNETRELDFALKGISHNSVPNGNSVGRSPGLAPAGDILFESRQKGSKNRLFYFCSIDVVK